MFRRKGGEADEARRDEESTPSVSNGRERRRPVGLTTSATVMFHPDVPHRMPDVKEREAPPRADDDGKRLTVGREITLSGCTIADCERLTVEGTIDATTTEGRLLEIAKGGCFKGAAVVDNAEIAGVFEGDLKVKKRLSIRASGYVVGTVRYGQLEVERGGRIDGSTEYDPADREADLQPVESSLAVAASDGSSEGR
jgi:cytoskeletal protein CcmA (bactofilin family)